MTPTFTMTINVTECPACGMAFGITEDFEKRRRRDHARFFCPFGHGQSYDQKTEEEKLRDQVAALNSRLDQTQAQLETARSETRREKKKAARVIKRATAGVCLHCHRTFQNVARHMATQHKETP